MRHATAAQFDRVQLIQVQTRNAQGQLGERFVPLTEYELWAQLMTSRHRVQPTKTRPCLWTGGVSARMPAIFEHAPVQVEVDRLTFSGFDESLGIHRDTVRYTLNRDTSMVAELMLKHLRPSLSELDVLVCEGRAYAQRNEASLVIEERPLSGDSMNDERIESLDYIELSCNMPRGLAPVRSTIRS